MTLNSPPFTAKAPNAAALRGLRLFPKGVLSRSMMGVPGQGAKALFALAKLGNLAMCAARVVKTRETAREAWIAKLLDRLT